MSRLALADVVNFVLFLAYFTRGNVYVAMEDIYKYIHATALAKAVHISIYMLMRNAF